MSYSIRSARSRSRTKRGNILTKGRTCFESRKNFAAHETSFRGLNILEEKRKPSLDFKHQSENCDRLKKKQGRLQQGVSSRASLLCPWVPSSMTLPPAGYHGRAVTLGCMAKGKGVSSWANLLISVKVLVGNVVSSGHHANVP
jgi:hypothetical protein